MVPFPWSDASAADGQLTHLPLSQCLFNVIGVGTSVLAHLHSAPQSQPPVLLEEYSALPTDDGGRLVERRVLSSALLHFDGDQRDSMRIFNTPRTVIAVMRCASNRCR